MSRIHNNPPPKAAPTKKPRSAATKSTLAKPAQKKPADKWAPTKAVAQAMERLEKSKKATETRDDDGTVTRERTSTRRDTTTTQSLTKSEGKLLETSTEYRKSTSGPRGDRESTFTAATDMLGRRSSQATTTTNKALENGSQAATSTKTVDHWGIEKRAREVAKETELENGTESSLTNTSRDSRGNKFKSTDLTRAEARGQATVTTNAKRAQGSELTTASSTTYEDKIFTLSDSADWKKTNSVERSWTKEQDYDASKVVAKADRLAGTVGKVLGFLGLEPKQWSSELPADRMKEVSWHQGDNSWVGARYGVSGGQSLEFDGQGLTGTFNRTASAGVYAEASGAVEGRYGSASYDARAKAEAIATVDGRGRLDLNGLDATLNAKVGASIEAEVSGQARTRGIQYGDTELSAGVEGRARAVAEASAEATGTVQVLRNPPTAVAKGSVGASAVAKVEGEVRASAGPFTVVASAYASAGAEARASGIIGYENGKLKIGGSAGAALGVGAGAGVTVEVDVAQIGELAKETAKRAADVNHDGKLDLNDAAAAVSNVRNTLGSAASKVRSFFGW